MTATPRTRWLAWIACVGIFIFGIVMALLGAVLPLLSQRLQIGLGQAGTLFLVMNFAMLATMPVQGVLMDHAGKKPILVTGALLVSAALVGIGSTAGFTGLLVSVFLMGMGGGCLNGAANTLVADLHTDTQEKNSALNLLGVFFGFGALSIPFLMGSLLSLLSLNLILFLAAGLSLLLSLLCAIPTYPAPKQQQALRWKEVRRLAGNPLVLLWGFLLFFQSGNEFVAGGYLSTYLTNHLGISIAYASFVLSAYWGAIMLARAILSRVLLVVPGAPLVLGSALLAAFAVSLLLLTPAAGLAIFAVVLVGLSFAGIFPTALGLAGSMFESHSGTLFGILFTIALTGGMIMPWAVGQIAAATGLRLALGLVVLNALMIAVLQFLISRRTRTATP